MKLCLWAEKGTAFPEYVVASGVKYPVNADFRAVLRIFSMLADGDVLDAHKYVLLRRMFYKAEAPAPAEAVSSFAAFASGGSVPESGRGPQGSTDEAERRFDFEFDAEEIYISFLSEYGIDLFDVEFMHFYRFKMLLSGLSQDSAFMRKIALRLMDLKGLKGAELAKAQRAKDSVRLPVRYTAQELREIEEFESVWGRL